MSAYADIPRLIGARVRFLRHRRGYSLAELGRRTGDDREVLGRLERGLHVPSLDTVARVARGLGCHPSLIVSAIDHVGGRDS